MSLRTQIKSLLLPQLNQAPSTINLPHVDPGTRIPKILHQVFFSHESPPREMPPEIRDNIARIREMNPEWEYRLYDYDMMVAFIRAHYGAQVLAHFERIAPEYAAARADLFRYLLMYQCGGVYLDVKSSVTYPLDEFLQADDRFILAQWRNRPDEQYPGWGLHYELRDIPGGEFQQWHIIAAPGHPFLEAVIRRVLGNIDRYVPAVHGVGKNGVLRVTGPTAYTLAIAPQMAGAPHRLIDPRGIFPLTFSIYGHDAHFSVFKTHYSQLDKPVIRLAGMRKLQSRFFAGLRKLAQIRRRQHPAPGTLK